MDYLQYFSNTKYRLHTYCFKPYYKWITFNTKLFPGIIDIASKKRFKPYYKWITFNTVSCPFFNRTSNFFVLNLIINGLPSILLKEDGLDTDSLVLKF